MQDPTAASQDLPGPDGRLVLAPHWSDLLLRLCSPDRPLLEGRRGYLPGLPDNVICFRRTEAAWLNGRHRGRFLHHRFTLILALENTVTVCVDRAAHRLRAGQGLLVFPFQFHHYDHPEAETLRWLFVTFEAADSSAWLGLRDRPFTMTPEVESAAVALVRQYLRSGGEALLVLKLGVLLEEIRAALPASTAAPGAAPAGELAARICRLAESSPEALKAKEMARMLGVSVSHLRAQFQVSSGVNLGRHLRTLRLERACGLLRRTGDRVTEIAEECGFSSIYVFSRAFRQSYGMSPVDYRRHFGRMRETAEIEAHR